jgi:hypothetical protein
MEDIDECGTLNHFGSPSALMGDDALRAIQSPVVPGLPDRWRRLRDSKSPYNAEPFPPHKCYLPGQSIQTRESGKSSPRCAPIRLKRSDRRHAKNLAECERSDTLAKDNHVVFTNVKHVMSDKGQDSSRKADKPLLRGESVDRSASIHQARDKESNALKQAQLREHQRVLRQLKKDFMQVTQLFHPANPVAGERPSANGRGHLLV